MYSQILYKLFCHRTSYTPFLIQQPSLPACSFWFAAPPVHLPFSVLPSFQSHKNYPACFCFWLFLPLVVCASTLVPFYKCFSPYQCWLLRFPTLLLSFPGSFHNLLYEHTNCFRPTPISLRRRCPGNTYRA